MNCRFPILVCCCLILIALTLPPARAQEDPRGGGEIDPTFCAYVCPQENDPCAGCKQLGVTTTCGQYWGRPANDLDGDGVVNTSDNCQCVANSNQANCDGDAFGNACDFQDNSWTRISVGTQRCYLDEDDHVYKITLEFYYQDVYRSACTGQTCYKKYLRGSIDCSPTSDLFQCCLAQWFDPDCGGAWNTDQCGLPRCSF